MKPSVISSIRQDHPRYYGDLIVRIVRTHHLVIRKAFTKEAGLTTDFERWTGFQSSVGKHTEAGKLRVNSETNDYFILARKELGWRQLVEYLYKLVVSGPL